MATYTLEYGTDRTDDRVSDSRYSATAIQANNTYVASIQNPRYRYWSGHGYRYAYDYDRDYFKVSVTKGNSYEINYDPSNLRTSYIRLTDDRGTTLRMDDNSYASSYISSYRDKTFNFTADYTGDLIIDVDGYSSYYGNYRIGVNETVPAQFGQGINLNIDIDSSDGAVVGGGPSSTTIGGNQVNGSNTETNTTINQDISGGQNVVGGGPGSSTNGVTGDNSNINNVNGDNNTINNGDVTIAIGSNNSQVLTFDASTTSLAQLIQGQGISDITGQKAVLSAPGWQSELPVNRVANSNESLLMARQLAILGGTTPSQQSIQVESSLLNGGSSSQTLRGLAGWDVIDGGAGNDSIRGGNGRDIITGGTGRDELWGDFGWNTYLANDDGSKDLIVIKSDQLLENWWYGKAGNSPNGEKADIITELDAFDQIKILGAATNKLSVRSASAHGQQGLGIFASGYLEAVYTGDDLNSQQLLGMLSGDNSSAVMANTQGFYGV
ncbi:hemolysin-type calcium-binding repeat family protein [Synechococcus sp. PROS-7-1]|uniref:calcium-binding protein n=1 Tax=Synechococcus sp. PROS-7-1 TaxID=1442556 RepID=UPI0016459A96|nr:hypothetical protein [Synechococcus sp. PROS-7-1]QNI85076.1 hemolysin-type calcium-binding repeat family protein [Synechococcus sp. PROS-7-1]